MKIQQEKKTVQNWIDKELSNRKSLFYKIPFTSTETAKKAVFLWAKEAANNTAKMDLLFDYDYYSYQYNFILPVKIETQNGVNDFILGWLIKKLFNYWLDHPPVTEKIKENPSGTTTGASDFHFIDIWRFLFGTYFDPNRGLGNY